MLAGFTSLWTSRRWWASPERSGDADGDAEKAPRLHRFAHKSFQRFAAGILEQQRRSSALAGKRKRPRRPYAVEFVPQFIFVGLTI